jgi:glycine/D-amino acid oxidase-like deaminating enzyme
MKLSSHCAVFGGLLPIFVQQAVCQGRDPGLPVDNPTISYWQIPPTKDVAEHQSDHPPTEVDVVIIGSGITGTSVARHLLKEQPDLRIAMVEAREACSGATGRNGGHIRPSAYEEYDRAKESQDAEEAAKIVHLRAAHVQALIEAADELDAVGRDAAEARTVDSIDAFFDDTSYTKALKKLETLKREVPDIGKEWTAWSRDGAQKVRRTMPTVA